MKAPTFPGNKPPVTVLCGFLGAGKTTLLRHLLAQAEGRRWAAVVNDVAALNVDGALVRAAAGDAAVDVIELGNGCVCCSSRDELAETIAELAAGGREGRRYDHILVETTGVAEPRGIAALFTRKNPFGRALGDFAALSALVSVVDVAAFAAEAAKAEIPHPRRPNPKGEAGARPVFELMLEQIECADVIVLNKCDLLAAVATGDAAPSPRFGGDSRRGGGAASPGADGGGALGRVEAIVRGLNPRAEVVRTERGQVAAEFLLGRARFDAGATTGAARWVRELNAVAAAGGADGGAGGVWVKKPMPSGGAPYHETRYGIRAWVYQARRPFDRGRFRALLEAGWPGLLRAKGFYWTREEPDEMGFLSVAGGAARFEALNPWWAALVENGRARREEAPAGVRAAWEEPYGDRRQELVFIGTGLDEAALRAALEGCLAE